MRKGQEKHKNPVEYGQLTPPRGDKKVVVFDLDGTVIDSTHRTPNNPDGTLDLQGYYKNRTRENIFKDTLLPLADLMREKFKSGQYHVVICTAREIDDDDLDFLAYNDLPFHEILDRNNCRKKYHWGLPDPEYKTKQLKKYKHTEYTFYDDAKPTIELFEQYPNVNMIDANQANGVFQNG
tara:strand:+ start:211 stop:750 length:540 start_codon:yes stop_codon:yes gene_type:complete